MDLMLEQPKDKFEQALQEFSAYVEKIRKTSPSPMIEHCAELYAIGNVLLKFSMESAEHGTLLRRIMSDLVTCMDKIVRNGCAEMPINSDGIKRLKAHVLATLKVVQESQPPAFVLDADWLRVAAPRVAAR